MLRNPRSNCSDFQRAMTAAHLTVNCDCEISIAGSRCLRHRGEDAAGEVSHCIGATDATASGNLFPRDRCSAR